VADQASEKMGKWEGIIGSSVNGMMSIKLKTRGKYFKIANLGSIFTNDMRRLLYSVQIRGGLGVISSFVIS